MLESFFIYGHVPLDTEKGEYLLPVVLLSYVIAGFASYAALTLTRIMAGMPHSAQKRMIHMGGAFAMGAGIWAMHFIGMLAYKMPMTMGYAPSYTLLSMLVAVFVAYGALAIVSRDTLPVSSVAIGAILLGVGISAMHYTGMAAMKIDADLRYIPSIFLLSVLIAIAASGVALWIAFTLARYGGKHQEILQVAAALIMGLAICGMHYTGMAASVFIPHGQSGHGHDQGQDFSVLMWGVAGISCLILVATLGLAISRRSKILAKVDVIDTFPKRLLAVSMFLTMATIIWMGSNSFYIHYFLTHDMTYNQKVAELADEIIYLESVKSQSVRKASTGDEEFEKRYNEVLIIDLHKKIAELPDKALRDDAMGMDAASNKIAALEGQYLQLVEAGRIKEAERVMHGEEYTRNNQLYVDGKRALSEKIRQASHENILHLENNIFMTLFLVLTVISILAVSWYFALKSINRWRIELQTTQQRAKKEARTVTLLRSVAATANQATGIEKALEEIIWLICGFLEWPVGHAYVVNTENNLLQSTNLWCLHGDEQYQGFKKVADVTTFGRGEGLPGRVWETMSFVWIADIENDVNASRRKACTEAGFKSGFAFPVKAQNRVEYVLEFFNTEHTGIDKGLQEIMEEIGEQLTKVIERVHTLKALEYAKVNAEAANVAKSDFLANMSHELRTPLNSIMGMLRLLKESELNEEEKDLISTAFNSSRNLLEIVNDILDLSKIEANEVELERIGFDLYYVFHSVLVTLEHIAGEKKISLTSNCESVSFPYVVGDPTRFGRILINLISNAIKYTDVGHVEINVMLNALDGRRIELYCVITDTGIGIPKEKQKSIFEKFVQADNSMTRKYGGTGLGLAITKQLVELMNGAIGVESEVGRGSVFWFRIPFEITDVLTQVKDGRRKRRNVGIVPPQSVRVLVAEDHPLNQLYIKKLLKKYGIHNYELVANGQDAIKRYKEASWDVVLMDCHMPEKNGYDTTMEIRALEKVRNVPVPVPIVAMTANAMVGDREKCLRCGMDDYVSKPIDIDELKDILAQWVRFEPLNHADAPKEASLPPEVAITDIPVDLSQLRTFTEGDEETEKEFLRVFFQQSDQNVAVLRASLTDETYKAWKEAAHMLKGGAGGIGAEKLRKLCETAQNLPPESGERPALFEAIEREYGNVRQYLKTANLFVES